MVAHGKNDNDRSAILGENYKFTTKPSEHKSDLTSDFLKS